MRLLLLTAMLLTAPAMALACPPREACMVALPSTVRAPELRARAASEQPAAAAVQLQLTLPAHAKSDDVEIPAFWTTLRERVYSQMPSYQQSKNLRLVLAPVVVTSPSDTVPGLGIAGAF